MFHRIATVAPAPDMRLLVEFMTGERKMYDVRPLLLKWDAFAPLSDPALFRAARVDQGGYGVVWTDEIDLSCDELWANGE